MTTTAHDKIARPAFRRDVQGLRAVAVTIVVLYHAGLSFPGGFIGVDVFFVLSGFVIMRGLLFELEDTGKIDLKAFALRRIKRLLPAFALLLTVVVPLGVLIAPVDGFATGARTAAAAVFFNANTYLTYIGDGYFSPSTELNPLLHTWSLSVEEQFYLVFPTVLFISWRIGVRTGLGGRRAVVAMLLLGGIVSLAASEVLASETIGFPIDTPWRTFRIDEGFAFYSAPTRAWEFGAGALVAFVGFSRSASKVAASAVSLVGLGLLGVCSFVYASPGTNFPGFAAALPVGATVLLLWAGEQGPLDRVLGSRVFQRIGDLSYGWYLWHWPMIVFATGLTVNSQFDTRWVGAAAALFALVPAELSMRLLEDPIRHARTFTPKRVVSLGMACMIIPVALAFGSLVMWDEVHEETLAAFDENFAPHIDSERGCNRSSGVVDDREASCNFRVDSPAGSAALVGDSNAGHFSEGAIGGMSHIGFDLQIDTMSSCLFGDVHLARWGSQNQKCADYVDATMNMIIDQQLDLVMIGHAGDQYVADDSFAVVDQNSGELLSSTDEKRQLIADGLARTVVQLRAAGIDVVVMQPAPRPRGWEPGACSIVRWGIDSDSCDVRIHPEDVAELRANMAFVNERVAAAGAMVLDVGGQWCAAGECVTRSGTQHLFRDETHITVAASESLADRFAQLGSGRQAPPTILFAD